MPSLIEIQDLCHGVEQSIRKGFTHDAKSMLESISIHAKMMIEEIENVEEEDGELGANS